ncbi:lysozyme inhibitor LprI family protein [Methylotuvimicrobium buryatense]|uniref:DUF1311 domain-containing protein n=1 Tax=Methylotuvimicrobium buryatense TaxID=95641 RepID=A0A4P9UIN4_METBY|nr:lysozyme inhibitor LprI family protein [Methylotuvimicrobium buryatense]QCW80989.1 DUF1311 domain-containing protein [Methylotuvimicrobium buryatense]
MNNQFFGAALVAFSLSVTASDDPIDCDQAMTTIEVSHCAMIDLERAEIELAKYLNASSQHYADDFKLIDAIASSQEQWKAYREAHCNAVFTKWRDGSIRSNMAILCKARLTQQRTHELWESFLTYIDITPPVLPEPPK